MKDGNVNTKSSVRHCIYQKANWLLVPIKAYTVMDYPYQV